MRVKGKEGAEGGVGVAYAHTTRGNANNKFQIP